MVGDGEHVSNAGPPRAYWSSDAAELLASLSTSKAGLTQRDADARLELHGENSVTSSRAAGTLRLLLRQVDNPLVVILIFGAVLSLLLRQWTVSAGAKIPQ